MRISTSMMFESGTQRISTLQSALLKTQAQIAANRRVLTPSDDPIAAARVLEVTQSKTINEQYAKNCQFATNSLNAEENTLKSVTTLIQHVQTMIVEAGNAAYDDEQRGYIATELQERLKELMGYANTRDNDGNHLFSGFKTNMPAFTATATGTLYSGDQGQRILQVGAVRNLAISDSGDAVFGRIPANKLFTSAPAVGNTGNATVSSSTVADATALTGNRYAVVFSDATNYSVYDTTLDPGMTGTPLATGAYTDSVAISFAGMDVTLTGTPAAGDTFRVNQTQAELAAAGGNTGSVTASPLTVADVSQLTGRSYSVVFDGAGNYSVFDTTLDPGMTTPLPASGAYTDPQTISVDGLEMTFSGTPDANDAFTISAPVVTTTPVMVNAGDASVSSLTITDAMQLTAHRYAVVFTDPANYAIFDTTLDPGMTGAPLANGAYTSGQPISFDGLQLTITGTPAAGDRFTVEEAAAEASNTVMVQTGTDSVFDMLNDLISLLQSSAATAGGKQALANGLALAGANFSNALDGILTVRASVGARLNELESLDSASKDRDLLYDETISALQDLDAVKAISELTLQKTTLEAAQQSYVRLMQLSIFNYL